MIVYEIKSPYIFYHFGFEYDNVIDTDSIYCKKSSLKILDYFLNYYKLYFNEHVINFFHNFCSIPKCEFSYDYQVETVSLLFRYLFQNQLMQIEKFTLNYLEFLILDKVIFY